MIVGLIAIKHQGVNTAHSPMGNYWILSMPKQEIVTSSVDQLTSAVLEHRFTTFPPYPHSDHVLLLSTIVVVCRSMFGRSSGQDRTAAVAAAATASSPLTGHKLNAP